MPPSKGRLCIFGNRDCVLWVVAAHACDRVHAAGRWCTHPSLSQAVQGQSRGI